VVQGLLDHVPKGSGENLNTPEDVQVLNKEGPGITLKPRESLFVIKGLSEYVPQKGPGQTSKPRNISLFSFASQKEGANLKTPEC
jgi:hypothetical protein